MTPGTVYHNHGNAASLVSRVAHLRGRIVVQKSEYRRETSSYEIPAICTSFYRYLKSYVSHLALL